MIADGSPELAARRQNALERMQAEGRLPSIVGAVGCGGVVAWSGRAGQVDSLDRQYRIGSLTKTFTAVLVMWCRERRLLDLDDPLGRHVAESSYADVSLRTLLAHISGMQSEPVGSWWERSPGSPIAEVIVRNDGSGRVLAPGVSFHYSNLGYALLGEVVARRLGLSWWEATRTLLLEPLGLQRTTYHPDSTAMPGHSVGHFAGTLSDEPAYDTDGMAPAGQLWSTVSDLVAWLDFLAVGRTGILDGAVLGEMGVAQPPADAYGLGLRLLGTANGRLVGHTGSMPGFLASGFVDPVTRESAVMLCNATTGVQTDLVPDRLLTPGPAEPVEQWRPSGVPPTAVGELLGLWFWGNSAQEIRWHNERLELRSVALGARTDRFALTDSGFVGVDGYHLGETLAVHRGADGTVDALECATFVYTRHPLV